MGHNKEIQQFLFSKKHFVFRKLGNFGFASQLGQYQQAKKLVKNSKINQKKQPCNTDIKCSNRPISLILSHFLQLSHKIDTDGGVFATIFLESFLPKIKHYKFEYKFQSFGCQGTIICCPFSKIRVHPILQICIPYLMFIIIKLMKSRLAQLAIVLLVSTMLNLGTSTNIFKTYETILPQNTYLVNSSPGTEEVKIELNTFGYTGLNIYYFLHGSNYLDVSQGILYTLSPNWDSSLPSPFYFAIRNSLPLPSAIPFYVKITQRVIEDSTTESVVQQQSDISIWIQNSGGFYQFAKHLTAVVPGPKKSGQSATCSVKVNPGQNDLTYYVRRLDENAQIIDSIVYAQNGGNIYLDANATFVVVYTLNVLVSQGMTSFSTRQLQIQDIGADTGCDVRCNNTGMTIDPANPTNCLCLDSTHTYYKDLDTCRLPPALGVAVCGDQIVQGQQACDSGTTASPNPGCSGCQIVADSGYYCYYRTLQDIVLSVCQPICGDGRVLGGQQCEGQCPQCDKCRCGEGFKQKTPGPGCEYNCGDELVVKGEQCDLGADNGASNKGCNDNCTLKAGYYLQDDGSVGPRCGDYIQISPQVCDVNDIGCVDCKEAQGYNCSLATPTANAYCFNDCGDGIVVTGEQCDLGDRRFTTKPQLNGQGYGCNQNCTLQAGYYLDYQSDETLADLAVKPICGDGIQVGDQECDIESPGCIDCVVQPGFSVTRDDSGVIVVSITNNCGDKALVDQEQCDLGTNPDTGANLNTQGSGCFNCQLEQGYYASKTIIGGVQTICGDGFVVDGKQDCDVLSPGCSNCKEVDGFECDPTNTVDPDYCPNDCGDGQVVTGEQCDLGDAARSGRNGVAGSGCNDNCTLQAGYYPDYQQDGQFTQLAVKPICGDQIQVGAEQCDLADPGCLECTKIPEYIYTQTDGIVTQIVNNCGDGVLVCEEVCDLGRSEDGTNLNTAANGCDNCRTIVAGWYCNQNSQGTSQCRTVCGDSIYVPQQQQCDNGNEKGCPNCIVHNGWACYGNAGQTSVCYACGNAMKQPGQQCDVAPGKLGCVGCKVATGYACTGQRPSVCKKKPRGCGDGVLEVSLGQQCDDDNVNGNDGCNPQCKIQGGYTCSGSPSLCTKIVPDTGDGSGDGDGDEDTSNSISTQNDNDQSDTTNDPTRR